MLRSIRPQNANSSRFGAETFMIVTKDVDSEDKERNRSMVCANDNGGLKGPSKEGQEVEGKEVILMVVFALCSLSLVRTWSRGAELSHCEQNHGPQVRHIGLFLSVKQNRISKTSTELHQTFF